MSYGLAFVPPLPGHQQTELDVPDANLPAAIAHYLKTMEMVKFHLPPRRDESGII